MSEDEMTKAASNLNHEGFIDLLANYVKRDLYDFSLDENERLRSALEEIAGWESAACTGHNDLTARLAGIAKRALEAE